MTHRSPLVTLAGLVAFFVIMFGVNLTSSAPANSYPPLAPASASAATSAPAPPSPAASTAAPSVSASPPPSPSTSPSAADNPYPEKIVYAGRTKDRSAAIAVAVLGNKAAAYLCDGRNVESWLSGRVDEDELKLTGKGGTSLEAELDDDGKLSGEVKINGDELDFTIGEAKKPAGLYRARGSKTTIGWIVLPDGSQVGIQTAGQDSQAAPPLDPDQPQLSVGGEELTASPVSGDNTF